MGIIDANDLGDELSDQLEGWDEEEGLRMVDVKGLLRSVRASYQVKNHGRRRC